MYLVTLGNVYLFIKDDSEVWGIYFKTFKNYLFLTLQ